MSSLDDEKTRPASHVESRRDSVVDEQAGHRVNAEDHDLTKWQAIKKHPWACAWTLYAIWMVLLVSFENQASGNILGIPRFRQDFGRLVDGEYVLDSNWQSGFTAAPIGSQVVGALISGEISDRIGRRFTLMGALVISFAAVTLEFVAVTDAEFFGGKFLNGLAVGIIQAATSAYIGEIVPFALRGLGTCMIALMYALGPFTVALIVNSTGNVDSRWAYRSVFCSQYGFAGVAALFIWFMPESPWWLVTKGREEAALRALHKLGYKPNNGEDKMRLENIKVTLEEVKAETDGAGWLECFQSSNLRRTLVAMAPVMAQQFSGINFAVSYSTYYAETAGYSTEMAYKLQITQQVISMTGNVMSWYLIDKLGRRPLTIYGLSFLTVLLWIMGGLATGGSKEELRGAVAMILIYCWAFNVCIGATAYVCLTEVATARLRVKTAAIGYAASNIISVCWNFALPVMFNPNRANLGGKIGFIFGGFSIIVIVLLYFYLPETRFRTYEELDEMFAKKVSARNFSSYVTNAEQVGREAKASAEGGA